MINMAECKLEHYYYHQQGTIYCFKVGHKKKKESLKSGMVIQRPMWPQN